MTGAGAKLVHVDGLWEGSFREGLEREYFRLHTSGQDNRQISGLPNGLRDAQTVAHIPGSAIIIPGLVFYAPVKRGVRARSTVIRKMKVRTRFVHLDGVH